MASVLLVEDEALIQMMIADMLAELGHSVVAEAGVIWSPP
ncbi:CheY-like chemotaxis protein [Bradyrhizobium sp. GM6.1]